MTHCVFMHKADSIYDDIPAERYQFPAQYLGRAEPSIGDWIVYLEPRKVKDSRGYFAVAKVERIVPDPTADSLLAPSNAGRGPSGPLGSGLPAGARSRLRAAGRSPNMFLALIEPETYLDFVRPVPFSGAEGVIERGLLNDAGAISGRAQAAVRPL